MTNSPATVEPVHGAVRFFWAWLVVAAGASVAGNVTHAIATAPNDGGVLAAAAAVVPPVVLLGSTHSVALLVKTRQAGRIYWCALVMTIALAGCAFVLSFDALSGLAAMAGMRADRAWLWPCAIDMSIAQSTLALLALTGSPDRASRSPADAGVTADPPMADRVPPRSPAASPGRTERVPIPQPVGIADAAMRNEQLEDPTRLDRWHPAARQLIAAGVTQKDPAVVALILAEHAAGVAPSAIGRRLDVHHSTVGRILAGAASLA